MIEQSTVAGETAVSTAQSTGPGAALASCRTCGHPGSAQDQLPLDRPFVYAIGRIEPRFPSLGVEKELAQAIGRAETARLTDREAIHAVLSTRDHFYLVRQLCWVLTIRGADAYLLSPQDAQELQMVLGALRPSPRLDDLDVTVGWMGPISDGRACNGARLPTLRLAQLYSFDTDGFVRHLRAAKSEGSEETHASTVEELLGRVIQLTGNQGNREEDRALNYLVTRDHSVYVEVGRQYEQNASLKGVRVVRSPLSGTRSIVDVVLEFRDRGTDAIDRRFLSVDVSDVFPFKVSPWASYTDRFSFSR